MATVLKLGCSAVTPQVHVASSIAQASLTALLAEPSAITPAGSVPDPPKRRLEALLRWSGQKGRRRGKPPKRRYRLSCGGAGTRGHVEESLLSNI